MTQMKTPDVHVVERDAFPSTVVEVAGAVPAFVGHTERTDDRGLPCFRPRGGRTCHGVLPHWRHPPGDLLVLADEAPVGAPWVEARRQAGVCLVERRQYAFALEQLDAALAVAPDDVVCRGHRAVCLGHLGRIDEARASTAALTRDHPDDADAWALAGRVEEEAWVRHWWRADAAPQRLRDDAAARLSLLEAAIVRYRRAFVVDPSRHDVGLRALTLSVLHGHLGGTTDHTADDDLAGGVRWASLGALARDRRDARARASVAERRLLRDPMAAVVRAYRNAVAVAVADGDAFALDALRRTPCRLRDLGFRPDESAAALAIVEAAIARAPPPFVPRQVLLFSGHLMDAPDRPVPRFPPDKEDAAARRIADALDALGAGPEDLALSQGAAGGDLLFVEACQRRGVRSQWLLPFDEPAFVDRSVRPVAGGERWCERYRAARDRLADAPRVMPVALGPQPPGADPYERCNRWLLQTALAWGVDRVRFVCLWNGGGGDGPGGTRHLHDEVKRRTGRVTWIDTRTL